MQYDIRTYISMNACFTSKYKICFKIIVIYSYCLFVYIYCMYVCIYVCVTSYLASLSQMVSTPSDPAEQKVFLGWNEMAFTLNMSLASWSLQACIHTYIHILKNQITRSSNHSNITTLRRNLHILYLWHLKTKFSLLGLWIWVVSVHWISVSSFSLVIHIHTVYTWGNIMLLHSILDTDMKWWNICME